MARKAEIQKTVYESIADIVTDLCDGLKPPERITPAEAAAKYRYLHNVGSYVGPWQNEQTPYMVEVLECCIDPNISGVVFVGPAQCGKTDAVLNLLTYSVMCDPMDMIIYEKSQAAARDFSRRRLDRLHRHSPEVGAALMRHRNDDNTFDKHYKNGMILTMSWPSINEMSGRPIGRGWLSDYDRMPQDIDKEGSPFDLARKRGTTFGKNAVIVAESSPGFIVEDPRWIQRSPHEAPPCQGILALYNRGDRRRWMWPCIHCLSWFEPSFARITYPNSKDPMEAAEGATMLCPHCSKHIKPERKYELNNEARWLREGCRLTRDGKIEGKGIRSDIASFWLKGPAAAFAPWSDLVLRNIVAEQEYERTGSQEALKTTVNTDQAEPFYPRGTELQRMPEQLKERAETWTEKKVPHGVRYLVATIDTQKNRWEVQVTGHGVGGDRWIIDRFPIVKSNRLDDDGERLWVKPHAYLEDWDLIIDQVLDKEYELDDDSGRKMMIRLVSCDMGGAADKHGSVTEKAYDFYIKLRRHGKAQRFILTKGDPKPGAPRVRLSFPDSERKDRKAKARGEVPVLMINVNQVKDQLNNTLDRVDPDGGMLHFADWLPDSFYQEMTAEVRGPKGWENPGKKANEAWDLTVYSEALALYLKADHINWEKPPNWAEEWSKNALVTQRDTPKPFAEQKKHNYDFAKLAEQLA